MYLLAGRTQDPFPDRQDEPGFFQQRDEFVGRYQAAPRALPAQQRFHAGDSTVGKINLGLVMEPEFFVFQRPAQLGFQRKALPCHGVHLRGVILEVVAPLAFGMMKRRIRILDQHCRFHPVKRINADSGAGRDKNFAAAYRYGVARK